MPFETKPYKKHGDGDDKQMAYLMDTIKSLVKKGLKKADKKKRKKSSCDFSSSNSDSEQESGYSDTGLHVNKCLKLDKHLALNLMSMEPHSITVTNFADKTISGNEKAIENAKTGRVTVIAAVMQLNSLTAIGACERQFFNKLCGTVESCQIFIRSQSLIAC